MSKLHFTKMHGTGNDYVYVNLFTEQVDDASKLAVFVSDRHFGIGSDGLILIKPSDIADCEMDMYNLDGSQGAMCGNGIRNLTVGLDGFFQQCTSGGLYKQRD